ncbi:MBL fold metallo-hydrolase [Rhodobium gokarnense]|uniref:Glyoxylase-like metal-dependent hydrolase (Beta-lactamase superfamily II) n=1 Tax=Rhodobium gokarnense TaxID=364296 RepID=A0ABT3HCY8_9HYPH|nr:MBL fold metallo-hydrolase [Rhodobium gokarnense]MCW2308274.1 glyoxylase-like metal-dependent hydrolase (beta-lactamase superfamily II) [Rhodobium gokarnense]
MTHKLRFAAATALALVLSTQSLLAEVPSTVGATYRAESSTEALAPGEKIENLFTKNMKQPYVLQKLTDRVYFYEGGFYGTIFYVGDRGVLLFDPLEGQGPGLLKAIAGVTDLPVTAIVYSHNHADHINDTPVILKAFPGAEIIATAATADQMRHLGSKHPAPTHVLGADEKSFDFEGLTVDVVRALNDAHAHDHAIFVLEGEKVAHIPDVINPDQPPFWAFAGSASYLGYRELVEQIGSLDWDYLSGGHGNVGSRADVTFYLQFLDDLEAAVGQAMGEVPWGFGVDASKLTAHTPMLPAWYDEIARRATESLRSKYGDYYGFEAATPANAEMVAEYLFSYR